MTGLVAWDAVIWALLGAVLGWMMTSWSSLRAALLLAILVTLGGMLAVGWQILWSGELGLSAAASILLFSLPATVGLALGGLCAHLVTGRKP